jgi:gluconokinase
VTSHQGVQPAGGEVSADAAVRPFALALDVGSSSVRAIVHDGHGRPVAGATVQTTYRMQTSAEGAVFVPVDELRRLAERTIDELCARCDELLRDVGAVGVACFSHSLVGLDEGGRPLTPVLSWADTTSAAAARELRAELDGEAVWRRTGAPLHASYWPARIRHQRATDRDVARWSGFAELLGEWLTGRHAASISIASATGLLDRQSDEWDGELLATLGISPSAVPALVGDDQPLGGLVGEYRRRWPALADAAWFPAWADGACGNVGLDCRGARRAALMIGTSSAMRVLLDRRDVEPPPGLFCFRLGQRGSLLGGQLSEGGGSAAWVSRLTGRSLAELDELAAAIEPVDHGLALLPYLSGERGPGYHAGARGVIDGLSLASGPGELFRAALEAVAVGLVAIDRLLTGALGQPPQVVAAGGAIAGSQLWPQVLADALGRPITLPVAVAEPSARGAALLALEYAGLLDGTLPEPGTPCVIEPDARRHMRYGALIERRNRLYERHSLDWE